MCLLKQLLFLWFAKLYVLLALMACHIAIPGKGPMPIDTNLQDTKNRLGSCFHFWSSERGRPVSAGLGFLTCWEGRKSDPVLFVSTLSWSESDMPPSGIRLHLD